VPTHQVFYFPQLDPLPTDLGLQALSSDINEAAVKTIADEIAGLVEPSLPV
jgi:hypothetical protein